MVTEVRKVVVLVDGGGGVGVIDWKRHEDEDFLGFWESSMPLSD